MARNIEKLLRLVADYHEFCGDAEVKRGARELDELSLEELDFIAAAGMLPLKEDEKDDENKKTVF